MNQDYQRIARAIAFMRQNHLNQPSLATVAEYVHLSEYHFQRLFTKWAGISPKRFLQYLTIEYAKSRITQTKSLLDLTFDVGLSSPGRLHDLFVSIEAMSPGEYKKQAARLEIRYGIHDSPFGKALIATTSRGICNLHFFDDINQAEAEQILRLEWKKAKIISDILVTQDIIKRIFQPMPFSFNHQMVLFVKGTNFQVQVWRALLQVPFGGLTTYQHLADTVNNPYAARAVGNALSNNPIAYLIPCHRVIRGDGQLGGYRWSKERKSAILEWENLNNENFKHC